MSEKFLDKYRIETARAKWWDYSGNGVYFVTINTYNREQFLSAIKDGNIELKDCGQIVKKVWENLPEHFPNVGIDDYVIMPDHFHGIIQIRNFDKDQTTDQNAISEENLMHNKMSEIALKAGPLARAIGNFKSVVTHRPRKINPAFKWQQRYYDKIIRDEAALDAAREYIRLNPPKWEIENRSVK